MPNRFDRRGRLERSASEPFYEDDDDTPRTPSSRRLRGSYQADDNEPQTPWTPAPEWVEQRIHAYDLDVRDLQMWLQILFPYVNIRTELRNDFYLFNLPRLLTEWERLQLELLYRPSSDEDSQATESSSLKEPPFLGPFEQDTLEVFTETGLKNSKITYHISHNQVDTDDVSGHLYRVCISEGFTCQVYQVDASWSWTSNDVRAVRLYTPIKIAIKRLSNETSLDDFLREYKALLKVAKDRHRNIVNLLNVFRHEDETGLVHYNFSFPLAACSLTELVSFSTSDQEHISDFSGSSIASLPINHDFIETGLICLWTEFEGLANALTYLHNICEVVHADIKSSNILLYRTDSQPPIVAKLADFGQAVDLRDHFDWHQKSKEYKSAWFYTAPEVRKLITENATEQPDATNSKLNQDMIRNFKSGDIWKLGAVFVELLSFLIRGRGSVQLFREYITTTHDKFTTDTITDIRFDDGERVKPQVLNWLSQLSRQDVRARELVPLLKQMLGHHTTRPTASVLLDRLRLSRSCRHFDGIRYVEMIMSEFTERLSFPDKVKELIEKLVRHKVDWWPFDDGLRTCPPGFTRIAWTWDGESLNIDVPDHSAMQYRKKCRPLSQAPQVLSRPQPSEASSTVYHQSDPAPAKDRRTSNQTTSANNSSESMSSGHTGSSTAVVTSNVTRSVQLSKEIYWCIDRAWKEPKETNLRPIQNLQTIVDDRNLCDRLLREYDSVRGWKGRYFSWKTCLGVDFIKYSKLYPGQNEIVRIAKELPPPGSSDYEYNFTPPEDIHMCIAEAQLVRGMHSRPRMTSGSRVTFEMIPKKVDKNAFAGSTTKEWGMHAQSHFSLRKIMAWVAATTALGLVFAILWLALVDKTDLQNAFVPGAFLATMMLIAMALPQILAVD